VLWLAWKFFRAGTIQGGAQVESASFADGALLLILNPKAYMIIALMFTQFLPPGTENFTQLLLAITIIFTLNNVLAFVVWAALGEVLSRFFSDERHARVANMIFAMLFVLIAVWMAAK
jgi:threonine/homoserine/homoserine lactone efflux protein